MDEKLIKRVNKYPCLWDTRLTTYKCNETKDAAWDMIVKETGLQDAKTAKVKWKKLRDNYRDAIKRQNSIRSGQATKQTCQWKYQQLMQFLLPHLNYRNRTSHFINKSEPVNSTYHDDTRMSALNTTDESELIQLNDLLSSEELTPSIDDSTHSIKSSTSSKARKRRPDEISASIRQHQEEHGFDDLDYFFLAISKSLKKLPTYLQLKVKRISVNAMLEAEEMNEQNSWSAPHYGYSTTPLETFTSGREQSSSAGSSSKPR